MQFQKYITEQKIYALTAYAEQAKKLIEEGKDVINLTIGDPIDETYPPVYQTLKGISTTNSQYPQNIGNITYRQAVADWAKRQHNIELCPQTQIISCNGTKEAIFHLPLLFDWSSGKKIFISELSYPVYQNSAEILNIPIHKLPANQDNKFLPNLDDISDEQWQQCQLFWINSPHNPTTTIASKDYFQKLLQKAQQYNFLVCSDECYNDLYYGDEKPTSALDFPNSSHWLIFRSLSKRSHMTGFRIGAILSNNKQLIANYSRLRNPMGIGSPNFIQQAAITAWNDDLHPQEFSQDYKKKRDKIKNALEEKGFEIFGAQAGFYLWFCHPNLKTSEHIIKIFMQELIFITSGTAFGKNGQGWCRLIYCITNTQVDKLVNRLKQLKL